MSRNNKSQTKISEAGVDVVDTPAELVNVLVKTSVVADVGLELLEFMHNLGEEADVQPEAKTPKVADVCHAIANAAGDWAGKILDAECWIDVEVGSDGKYFRSALATAIKRQEIDGFLSLH